MVPSKSTTTSRLNESASPRPAGDGVGVVAVGDQLQERLGALQGLHRLHLADRDALALAEPQQRLAVAREQPPHRFLAVPVEVPIDADVTRDRAAHGLV